MPDNSSLTIGATFDKEALDASMADAQTSIRAIPETFNIAFQEVSSVGKRALRQISDDTKTAAASISEQWRNVAAASAQYTAAQGEVRAASRLVVDGSQDEATSLGLLAAAKQRAAQASADLAVAEKMAAGTAEKEVIANDGLMASLGHLRERLTLTSEGIRGNLFESGGFSGALGAALGVAVVGEFVNKLKETEIQFGLLANSSGVTVESLARLQAAFQIQGVSVDNFSQVLTRLAEHMAEAQDGDKTMADYFAALGVSADDLKNQSLGLDDILQLMARHLQMSAGNSQDLGIAYALLGRGAGQFVSGLKGLNKTLEENKAHLDQVASASANAVNSANQLEEAEKTLSQAATADLLPALPAIVIGLKALGEAFEGVTLDLEPVVDYTIAFFASLTHGIEGLGKSINDNLHGRMIEAQADLHTAGMEMKDDWKTMNAALNADTAATIAEMRQIWATAPTATAPKGHPAPLVPHKKSNPDKTAMEGFEAELAQQKLSHQMSLSEELAFWASKISLVKAGSAQHLEILKIEAGLIQEIAKKSEANQLAMTEARVAADAAAMRMEMEDSSALVKAISADINARAKALADAHALEMQGNEAAALASVAAEQAKNQSLESLGRLTAQQRIALDEQTENQSFQIQKAYLEEKIALLNESDPDYPKQRQQILNQIDALTASHMATEANLTAQSAEATKRAWDSVTARIQQTLDQTLRSVITGTERMSQAWRKLGSEMVSNMATSLLQIGMKVLEHEAMAEAAHKAAEQAKTAATAQGAAQQTTVSLAASLKKITGDAGSAASGAYSAMSGIPIIGPELGAVAAAVTFAAVEAFGGTASAAGGQWMVPAVQPTLLHPREMVIPAREADGLRQVVDHGGAGGHTVHVHYNLNASAIDGKGMRDVLREHAGAVADAVHHHLRRTNRR